jgi:hypothetical protein
MMFRPIRLGVLQLSLAGFSWGYRDRRVIVRYLNYDMSAYKHLYSMRMSLLWVPLFPPERPRR